MIDTTDRNEILQKKKKKNPNAIGSTADLIFVLIFKKWTNKTKTSDTMNKLTRRPLVFSFGLGLGLGVNHKQAS